MVPSRFGPADNHTSLRLRNPIASFIIFFFRYVAKLFRNQLPSYLSAGSGSVISGLSSSGTSATDAFSRFTVSVADSAQLLQKVSTLKYAAS